MPTDGKRSRLRQLLDAFLAADDAYRAAELRPEPTAEDARAKRRAELRRLSKARRRASEAFNAALEYDSPT